MRAVYPVVLSILILFVICCNESSGNGDSSTKPQPVRARQEPVPADTEPVVTWESDWAREMAEEMEQYKSELTGNWPLKLPELPACAGWYRHLGTEGFPQQPFSFSSYAGVTAFDNLFVYDRQSGNSIWQYNGSLTSMDHDVVGGDGWICFAEYDTTMADMETGEKLWETDDAYPVAAVQVGNADAVWIAHHVSVSGRGEFIDYIDLVDVRSGSVLQHFDTNDARGAGTAPGGDPLYTISSAGLLVLSADGSESVIDVEYTGEEAEIQSTDSTVLVLQSVPSIPDPDSDVYSFTGDEGDDSIKAVLTAVDTNGKQLWRSEIKEYLSFYLDRVMHCNSELAVLNLYPGMLVFDIDTGELLFANPESNVSTGASFAIPAGRRILWDGYDEHHYDSRLIELDPDSGEERDFLPLDGISVRRINVSDNLLLVLGETNPGGGGVYGSNHHLFAFELDENHQLVPGELTIWNAPEDQGGLAKELYADINTSEDELVEQLVSGGTQAFQAMLEKFDSADDRTLKALMRVAIEQDPEVEPGMYRSMEWSPVDALVQKMIAHAKPEFSPVVISWLDGDLSARLRFDLVGVLAACGGDAADTYLKQYYDELMPAKHVMSDPPYKLELLSEFDPGLQWPDEAPQRDWARTTDANGGQVVAIAAESLANPRQIFIAFDGDSDGQFEEILPTGLTDTFYYIVHPGGEVRVTSQVNMEVRVDGDVIEIAHHQAETGLVDIGGEYGSGETYEMMTGAPQVTDTFTLAELRADSDGDGLTDIAERQLLTNPDNPDTDGDGISDPDDLFPNVDQSAQGRLERGVARALACYFNTGDGVLWWENRPQEFPCSARFIHVKSGAGPVAFTLGSSTYGICINSEDGYSAYEKLLDGYNPLTCIEVNVADAETVYINAGYSGHAVVLADVNGELYPVSVHMTWIA